VRRCYPYLLRNLTVNVMPHPLWRLHRGLDSQKAKRFDLKHGQNTKTAKNKTTKHNRRTEQNENRGENMKGCEYAKALLYKDLQIFGEPLDRRRQAWKKKKQLEEESEELV